jgi:WD40 repeat protein
LAVGLRSGPICVWNTSTWERLFTAKAYKGQAPRSGRWGSFRVAFSPDSRLILSTYQSRENGIHLRDAKNGAVMQAFGVRQTREPRLERSHADYLYELAYSPDGRRMATSGGNGTVKIWDMNAFREVLELRRADSLFSVQFSPDGRRLAIGSGVWTGKAPGRITIWDAGIPQNRFTGANPPADVAIAPSP